MNNPEKFKENLEIVLKLLKCPNCDRFPLVVKEDSLFCPFCKENYPFCQGILDLTPSKIRGSIDRNKFRQSRIMNRCWQARFYDIFWARGKLRLLLTGQSFKGELNKRLSLFDLPSEGEILDIGCSTGNYTLEFAKRTKGIAIGLDISFAMLQVFKENAAKLGLRNIFPIRADAMHLPFRQESLTKIYHGSLHYILPFFSSYDYKYHYKNLYSLLAPGGVLCGTFLSLSNSFIQRKLQFLAEKVLHPYFLDPKILARDIKEAGLVDFELEILKWLGAFKAKKL